MTLLSKETNFKSLNSVNDKLNKLDNRLKRKKHIKNLPLRNSFGAIERHTKLKSKYAQDDIQIMAYKNSLKNQKSDTTPNINNVSVKFFETFMCCVGFKRVLATKNFEQDYPMQYSSPSKIGKMKQIYKTTTKTSKFNTGNSNNTKAFIYNMNWKRNDNGILNNFQNHLTEKNFTNGTFKSKNKLNEEMNIKNLYIADTVNSHNQDLSNEYTITLNNSELSSKSNVFLLPKVSVLSTDNSFVKNDSTIKDKCKNDLIYSVSQAIQSSTPTTTTNELSTYQQTASSKPGMSSEPQHALSQIIHQYHEPITHNHHQHHLHNHQHNHNIDSPYHSNHHPTKHQQEILSPIGMLTYPSSSSSSRDIPISIITDEDILINGYSHSDNNMVAVNYGRSNVKNGFIQSTMQKLLPMPHSSDQHKLCVVIDLDETLVHSSFKPVDNADFVIPVNIEETLHQVYVLKRPHVDEFLRRVSDIFECVLFTASLAKYADPVANLLDCEGKYFKARLFREACVFYQGNYVKDLNRLGRNTEKVVIIDNSPASYIFNPENAIPITSWFGDPNDDELLKIIPMLQELANSKNVIESLGIINLHQQFIVPCN